MFFQDKATYFTNEIHITSNVIVTAHRDHAHRMREINIQHQTSKVLHIVEYTDRMTNREDRPEQTDRADTAKTEACIYHFFMQCLSFYFIFGC